MMRTLRPKVTAVILSASVLALFLVGLSSLPTSSASNVGAGATLNPVQITIQTTNLTSISSYNLVAYNSTGIPVASYTGQYPQVTFELPSGTYLFAATANGPASSQPQVCCLCAQSGAGIGAPALKTNAGSSASSAIAFPCAYGNPSADYGYSLTKVSGSTSLTIATQSPSAIPTADVSVSVSFKNGTAVSGAYVSANVVGANLYWGGNSSLSMSAQTATNGVAQLVVPAVPLTVTASESVEVNLTQSQTTVQVNVGGQPVNVTLYYSPNYVYLSASALLIPPQTSLSMVLNVQTQSPLIPFATGSASSSVATPNPSQIGQASQGASPSSSQIGRASQGAAAALSSGGSTTTAQISAIPPIPASDLGSLASTRPASSISGISLLTIGTLALAGGVAAIVGIAISRTKR
ncbi:MAG TPA: hypothetical protein VND41_01990 [Nitrososphaerales archaeon]|nr:hypothetical protein [Nitrososphaerales archaeon]